MLDPFPCNSTHFSLGINSFPWYQLLYATNSKYVFHFPDSVLKNRPISSTINCTLSLKYFKIQCVPNGTCHRPQIRFCSCVFYLGRRYLYIPGLAWARNLSVTLFFLSISQLSLTLPIPYQTLSYYFHMLYLLNVSMFLDISWIYL